MIRNLDSRLVLGGIMVDVEIGAFVEAVVQGPRRRCGKIVVNVNKADILSVTYVSTQGYGM